MRTSTKSALAAVAGAGLLLGGLGSLAYWEDEETAGGGTVTAGSLDLAAPVCQSWQEGGADVDLATFTMVPGDELTRSCDFAVDLAGQNLETSLGFDVPSLATSTLADELTFGATYAVDPATEADYGVLSAATPTVTTLADEDVITVRYRVALPFGGNEVGAPGVDNDSNSGADLSPGALTAVLGDLQLTLTQTQPQAS